MESQRVHARCGCGAAPGGFALAGTQRQYERARPFAIRHLALDLSLDLDKRRVAGSATLTVERLAGRATTLTLDALGFEIASVTLDAGEGAHPAPHHYDGSQLTVEIAQKVRSARVAVHYSAAPRRGLYFLRPDEAVPGRPVQVWSQCQDEDARHWFPCHDAPHMKMTSALRVSVPRGMMALSNGECVERTTRGGRSTFAFRMDQPHPSYLVTLVVGTFDVVTDRPASRGGGLPPVPVTYLVPPGRAEDARRSLGETPGMIERFGALLGVPYPFGRYTQVVVHDFIFGGMENTTATTLYEHVLLDARAAVDVTSTDLVAHELAHQWFGDHVTCRDWSHGWLNEGFATFFEQVDREQRLGRDEYDAGVAQDLASYLGEAASRYQRPIVCRDYAEPIDLFDRHLYEKGGLVLHMLRRRLGDAAFWAGVRLYLERHAGGVAETRDLQRALEETSATSLDRFFDEWVFRPGHPVLKVKVTWEAPHLVVHVEQTQKTGEVALFELPVMVEVHPKAGRVTRHERVVTQARDALVIKLAERPTFVVFDPEFALAVDLTLEAPADMLRAQLGHAPTARSRVQAAHALARRNDAPTVAALSGALGRSEAPWMARAAAAAALGEVRHESALEALLAHQRTSHPKVRRAVVSALGRFPEQRAAQALLGPAAQDPSYLVQAEAARALGATRRAEAREALLALLDTPSWADVVRAGALDGLGALGDETALAAVAERTRYGVPTRGRRAALLALPRLGDGRAVRQRLELLLDDADPHLRIDAIGALLALGDPRARGALARRQAAETDGRVQRRLREALRDLGDASATERRRVADEVETLKRELAELTSRLGRLEERRSGARARRTQAPAATHRAAKPTPTRKRRRSP